MIAISMPFPFQYSNPWIVVMVLFWILDLISGGTSFSINAVSKWVKASFFSFLLLFALYGASLLYTENLSFGLRGLEGKLSLLVFPIVFYTIEIDRKLLLNLLKAYSYSIFLTTIVLLINSALNYFNQGSWLTYHDFTAPLSAHAVFYSYYLFVCILISIHFLSREKPSKLLQWYFANLIILSLIALVFLASKNVTIVSVVFALLLLMRRYFKRGVRLKELVVLVVLLVTVVFLGSQLNSVQSRMSELFSSQGMQNYDRIVRGEKIGNEESDNFNGTSLRLTFWHLGLKEINDRDRLLIGLSPGDRRDQMNESFTAAGIWPYIDYNLHNQFIQILVELGIIGLLVYVFLNFSLLMSAIRKANYLLLIFLLATIIFQLTESILERNKTIVFFIFFLCLLQHFKSKPEHEDRYSRY